MNRKSAYAPSGLFDVEVHASPEPLSPEDYAARATRIAQLRIEIAESLGHQCQECLVDAHIADLLKTLDEYSFYEEVAKRRRLRDAEQQHEMAREGHQRLVAELALMQELRERLGLHAEVLGFENVMVKLREFNRSFPLDLLDSPEKSAARDSMELSDRQLDDEGVKPLTLEELRVIRDYGWELELATSLRLEQAEEVPQLMPELTEAYAERLESGIVSLIPDSRDLQVEQADELVIEDEPTRIVDVPTKTPRYEPESSKEEELQIAHARQQEMLRRMKLQAEEVQRRRLVIMEMDERQREQLLRAGMRPLPNISRPNQPAEVFRPQIGPPSKNQRTLTIQNPGEQAQGQSVKMTTKADAREARQEVKKEAGCASCATRNCGQCGLGSIFSGGDKGPNLAQDMSQQAQAQSAASQQASAMNLGLGDMGGFS